MSDRNFVDDRHALYAGWIVGIAARHAIPLRPVMDDDGNYTDALAVDIRSGITIRLIVPPPPDDWTLDG